MNIKLYVLLMAFISCTTALYAQKNVVSVNPLTGTANVVIPLNNISSGGISAPVNLVYSASGVKVKETESSAGMGWQLSAGGQVSRQLRGLPDDALKDNAGTDAVGWLHNSNSSLITGFTIHNTNNNCTDENTDITYLNSNFSYNSDTEPDVFNVNAPGLSFQFAFDGSHTITPLSYQDVKVSYITNSATGLIMGFTIINDKGTTYSFALADTLTKTTSGTSAGIAYFKNEYLQYQHSISFSSTWYLTGMTDANGNELKFNYQNDIVTGSDVPFYLYVSNPGADTVRTFEYTVTQQSRPKVLTSINNKVDSVKFRFANSPFSGHPMLSSVSGTGITYNFGYNMVASTDSKTYYTRYFLAGLSAYTDNRPAPPINRSATPFSTPAIQPCCRIQSQKK